MFRREDREIALGISIENGRFKRCGRLIAMFPLDFLWQPPPSFFLSSYKFTEIETVLRLFAVMTAI